MDTKVRKLARRLGDEALAANLVKAGLDNPRKLREASDAELEKAVGKAGRSKVRERHALARGEGR